MVDEQEVPTAAADTDDGAATETTDAPNDTAVPEAASGGVSTDAGERDALRRRVDELERGYAEERERATDYMQRWQRAQADFSNFKRRAEQEQDQRDRLGTARALAAVLPALDSLERAFAAVPPTLRGFSWIDGIGLVHAQLVRGLEVHGLRAVDVVPGQAFDPSLHEAIGEVESDEHPAGSVAVVVQRGYEAAGLLIRPALVQVARPPTGDTPKGAPPAEDTAAEDTAAEDASTEETT